MKQDTPPQAPAFSGLFKHVEAMQGDRPWGALLDAGTGTNSISWIGSLVTQRWTAITGAEGHAAQVRKAARPFRRDVDRVIVDNWANPQLLSGERYDTILADYLLGAIEGFAPYFQHKLFARLLPLLAGRLYIVGLEPYVTAPVTDEAGRIVSDIGRFRDACLLLAGERPYREYPAHWVADHLEASGYRVVDARRMPIHYRARFVNSQIDMCLPRLARLADRRLAEAMTQRGEALREEALSFVEKEGRLSHGHDYILATEPE